MVFEASGFRKHGTFDVDLYIVFCVHFFACLLALFVFLHCVVLCLIVCFVLPCSSGLWLLLLYAFVLIVGGVVSI